VLFEIFFPFDLIVTDNFYQANLRRKLILSLAKKLQPNAEQSEKCEENSGTTRSIQRS
jgi:hypothetical protein